MGLVNSTLLSAEELLVDDDATVPEDVVCCGPLGTRISVFRFSHMFSFGGGAGTNLTGATGCCFSALPFLDGFRTTSTPS